MENTQYTNPFYKLYEEISSNHWTYKNLNFLFEKIKDDLIINKINIVFFEFSKTSYFYNYNLNIDFEKVSLFGREPKLLLQSQDIKQITQDDLDYILIIPVCYENRIIASMFLSDIKGLQNEQDYDKFLLSMTLFSDALGKIIYKARLAYTNSFIDFSEKQTDIEPVVLKVDFEPAYLLASSLKYLAIFEYENQELSIYFNNYIKYTESILEFCIQNINEITGFEIEI